MTGAVDFTLDRLPPVLVARPEVKRGELMLAVPSAVGKGHEYLPVRGGRHAHEGIPEPLLPDHFSGDRQDFELAALGVEDDKAVVDHRGRRAIVRGPVLPVELPRHRIEGVKLEASEAATDEDLAADHGRRRKGSSARDDDLPAPDLTARAREGCRIGNRWSRTSLFHDNILRVQ